MAMISPSVNFITRWGNDDDVVVNDDDDDDDERGGGSGRSIHP